MFRYFKRHILLAFAVLMLGILTQLLTPISAIMEQQMVDFIISGDMAGFFDFLWAAGAAAIGVAFCYFFNDMAEKSFSAKFGENLRGDLYDGIMRRSITRFEEHDTAEYMSFVNSNAGTLVQNLSRPVFFLISYGVSALVVLGIMFCYSPLLAAASLVCGALSMILPLRFNKKLEKLIMDKVMKSAALSVQLKGALNGHAVIASFGVLPKLRSRFIKSNKDVAEAERRMGVTISELENVGQIMDHITWFITFLIAGTMAACGDISVGTLVMFLSLFGYFSGSVTIYAQLLPLLFSNKENIKMMLGIIDDDNSEFAGTERVSFEDIIEVRDLSFRYKEEVPVLEHLNLTVHKNEKVALIGSSGCGKSTLIKLLTGTYANYSGDIRYDGTELHDVDTKKLRGLVTVIHQNTFIFNESVRFNICLGEYFSEEALTSTLRLSGVDCFLSSIKGGLDGDCGENGSHLTGGQRQRIALARALIRNVKVLILDEGVSAIDVATANEIEQDLIDMKDLTLLTITHRIKDGLIGQYDRVMMMKDGMIEGKQVYSGTAFRGRNTSVSIPPEELTPIGLLNKAHTLI